MRRHLKKIIMLAVMLMAAFLIYRFGRNNFYVTGNVNSELVSASYIRTVDGDTIVVGLEGMSVKIRLIGIDAPESVHGDESQNSDEGEASAQYLETLLKECEEMYLQYDKEREDIYGRTLAYVWLKKEVDISDETDIEEYMLNARIVSDGYAYAVEYPPNTTYAPIFVKLQKKAENSQNGLWKR